MKYELTKTHDSMFNEYYAGHNPQTGITVTCILDDNCVRYNVYRVDGFNTKRISRHEYSNRNKARCFESATKALNA